MQTAVAFANEHTVGQAPQCAGSLLRLTSHPFVVRPSQFAKPLLQLAMPHVLAAQLAVALGNEHTVPQPPQLAGSVSLFTSQPLPDMPSQSRVPAGQVVTTQLAIWQIAPPKQTVGHVPQ